MTQEREHKKYSPSASEQFFLCKGAPNLLARTPARPSGPYAEEGHVAHDILEAGLRAGVRTGSEAIAASDYDGLIEAYYPDEHKLNELKAAITDALVYVWSIVDDLNETHGDAQLFVETRVNPPVQSAPGEAAGYCDVAIYSAKAGALWIIDYKHGVGIAKAVLGNTQIKQYGAGFLYDEQSFVDPNCVDEVTLVIIQPRAFHPDGEIREYKTTPLELLDYLWELDGVIEECEKPDAPLTPGVEQCRFCDARSTCPAIERQALSLASNQFASVRDLKAPAMPAPESLDVARLAYIFQHASMLRSWLNDVESHIYQLNMDGVNVPGTKLVEADARRTWYGDEMERATKLAALIGCQVSDLYRSSFKTITDVEKLITAAFKARVGRNKKKQAAEDAKQMFAYFTTKESSGNLTVVSVDDPRPSANRALRSFQNVAGLLPPPSHN